MNPIDATALIRAYNDFTSNKVPFKLSNYYSVPSFIPHILPIFAQVHLVRNENNLISMELSMLATKGSTYGSLDSESLGRLVMFVGEANRSMLYTSKSVKTAYKAFTPLFMYAHKLYNDVEYSEWDKDDKYIQYALGRSLYRSLEYARVNPKPQLNVKQLREELMTYKSGAREGQVEKITSYKMVNYDGIPSDILRMELQTWIANAELRDENSMILDMWDWSNIPTPHDTVIPPTVANGGIPNSIFDL